MNDQCGGPGGEVDARLGRAQRPASRRGRRAMVPALPSDLHADVVAGAVVAGGGDQDERAVVEGEHGGGGVDVAGLGEERLTLVGARRVDRRRPRGR